MIAFKLGSYQCSVLISPLHLKITFSFPILISVDFLNIFIDKFTCSYQSLGQHSPEFQLAWTRMSAEWLFVFHC